MDGFHPLDTVFEALDIYESVSATYDPSEISLTMLSGGEGLPTDERNIAVKAAMTLRESFGVRDGVRLQIDKRIPVAGGMAGGSADAAATLVACNELWELEASRDDRSGDRRRGFGLGHDAHIDAPASVPKPPHNIRRHTQRTPAPRNGRYKHRHRRVRTGLCHASTLPQ